MSIEYFEVGNVVSKQRTISYYSSNRFEFRKDRKYIRLQKALFWALDKLGCYAKMEEVVYPRQVVDTDDFINNLYKSYHEVLDFYDLEGEHLLVGNDVYVKLTKNKSLFNPIYFTGTFKNESAGEILGLKITVIPWMEGILILPKGIL